MLHGKRAGTARPEAVLLVLDSTNLARHLMLAAPILALGLPTLIILNMADDLRSREGKLDLRKLSHELGAPGHPGQRARRRRHRRRSSISCRAPWPSPCPALLPVLHDVPKCREWAGARRQQSRLPSPHRAQVDAPPR